MKQPGWPVKFHVTVSLSVTTSQLYRYDSLKYLLLGSNDDENMRLLLIPVPNYQDGDDRRGVEIKTIPLTWSQARAKLNRLWEEKYGKGDYEPSEESGSEFDAGKGNYEPPEESDSDSDSD